MAGRMHAICKRSIEEMETKMSETRNVELGKIKVLIFFDGNVKLHAESVDRPVDSSFHITELFLRDLRSDHTKYVHGEKAVELTRCSGM
jgi:hypothetical protein